MSAVGSTPSVEDPRERELVPVGVDFVGKSSTVRVLFVQKQFTNATVPVTIDTLPPSAHLEKRASNDPTTFQKRGMRGTEERKGKRGQREKGVFPK